MTPREINALVAERVMGLEPWPEQRFNEKAFRAPRLLPGQEPKPCLCPEYSTDISAAWSVVEKMLEFNPFWNEKDNLSFELSPTKPKGWTCNFGDDTTRAYADTAPMAICLATLKACGVEI